jgi:hypothetical protein
MRVTARWQPYVSQRLDAMARGEGDWTGLQRPTQDTLRKALFLATGLFLNTTPTPSVVPGELGEVTFVWHKAGWHLEIAVLADGNLVWAHRKATGTMLMGPVDELRSNVMKILVDLEGK